MSLRAAVNAKCRECIYDPHGGNGTWRQQVTACTSPRCPLFAVRPQADRRATVENQADLTAPAGEVRP